MTKEYCRYAITDMQTGVMLVSGEKYKAKDSLCYVGVRKGLRTHFRALPTYARYATIKGRLVTIAYWFNTPVHKPWREVKNGGLLLGLQ